MFNTQCLVPDGYGISTEVPVDIYGDIDRETVRRPMRVSAPIEDPVVCWTQYTSNEDLRAMATTPEEKDLVELYIRSKTYREGV